MVICTLVSTPRLGGWWWSIPDVVMMFVRVEEIIRGECVSHQRCGVDRVFYCFFTLTISTLPASFSYVFKGDRSPGWWGSQFQTLE